MSEIKYVTPSGLTHYDEKIKEVIDKVDTSTNTKVTQTPTSTDASYPLLLSPSGQTQETNTTSYFNSGVVLNPSTKTISADIDGNSATATCLTNSYTYDARPTSADDFDTFNKMGIMFSSSAMTTNRPSSDGAIVQIGWDNPESPWNNSRQQLFLPHDEEKGGMQYRGWQGSGEAGSTTGAWWAWRTLLDSNNYSKYIANNLTTTTTGYALDATQGKALNDKFGKVLWENTNPVAFDTMNITLSSDDYDVLDIYYLWKTTSVALLKTSTLKGYNAVLRQSGFVLESDNITIKELSVFTRDVVRNSDTSFSVNGFISTSPNNYTNAFLIPIKIIGMKLS